MTRVEDSGRARFFEYIGTSGEHFTRLSAAFTCDECASMSIGEVITADDLEDIRDVAEFVEGFEAIEWIPAHATGRDLPDVPSHIGSPANEAFKCQSVQAYRAACSLARAVVEATAKDKGLTNGTVAAKIDAMARAGYIRPHIQEAAHEVRYLANEMAHGDFIQPVSSEESALALELMAEVLAEVYQSPARVARARAAREARRAVDG